MLVTNSCDGDFDMINVIRAAGWVFGSFYLIGAPIGSIMTGHFVGYQAGTPAFFLAVVFGYGLAFFPALLASLIDVLFLTRLRGKGGEMPWLLAVGIGVISGLSSGVILLVALLLWEFDWQPLGIFAYILVFIVPSALCGLANKVAWRELVKR